MFDSDLDKVSVKKTPGIKQVRYTELALCHYSLLPFIMCYKNCYLGIVSRVPTESWKMENSFPDLEKLWTSHRFGRGHGKVMEDGFHGCLILASLHFGKMHFFKGV